MKKVYSALLRPSSCPLFSEHSMDVCTGVQEKHVSGVSPGTARSRIVDSHIYKLSEISVNTWVSGPHDPRRCGSVHSLDGLIL